MKYVPILHVCANIALVAVVVVGRIVWAGFRSEYGERGPRGEYLYRLDDPAVWQSVILSAFAIAAVVACAYWLVVVAVRRLTTLHDTARP